MRSAGAFGGTARHKMRSAFATLPLFLRSALAASTTLASSPTPIVPGLAAIADRYDAFLLDQFGVLHDGAKPLPGAVACFEALAAMDKKLIVLSNTSRRRRTAIGKFPKLGFDSTKLLGEGEGFVTSGEAAWEYLRTSAPGRRVLWLSWSETFQAWDAAYLDGLGLELAPASQADFVLCQGSHDVRDGGATPTPTGVFETGKPNDELDATLRTCAERALPMVCGAHCRTNNHTCLCHIGARAAALCFGWLRLERTSPRTEACVSACMHAANPDFTVALPGGSIGHMPGCIAAEYERLGGAVTYFGKPHAPAFEGALRLLGPAIPPSRVCHVSTDRARRTRCAERVERAPHADARAAAALDSCCGLQVGDSLLHDIAGANAAGVDSLFIAAGIHAAELGIEEGSGSESIRPEQLQQLFDACDARPTYTTASFVW